MYQTMNNLLNWEPGTTRRQFIFISLALLIFMAVPMYQATRQPRVGDLDIIRVGLIILNRNAANQFPGDLAMQAGDWWPNYIPLYIGILSIGYRILGDFELLLWLGCGLAYLLLLSGFYLLGRRLGLSLLLSLILAFMSGLYIPSALVTSWTGIRLEMASARNLYLALVPWIGLVALHFYQHYPLRLRYWGLFGLTLGGLASLHPVDGAVTICILGVLMLIGVVKGQLSLSTILAFGFSAMPGLILIYVTIYAPYTAISDFPQGFNYNNLTRANVFFYRLPNFIYPIAVYTLLTMVSGIGCISSHRLKSVQAWRITFAGAQFFGALLLLPQDWLVLLAFVLCVQARLWRSDHLPDVVPLCVLFAVNLLALCVGLTLWLMNTSLDITFVNFAARAFLRTGRLSYGAIIILGITAVSHLLHVRRDRGLLLLAIISTVILGLHEHAYVPELDAIPYAPDLRVWGQWLPLDPWAYSGVGLVVLWIYLPRAVITGWIFALMLQATTRLLAAPADNSITILFAIVVVANAWILWRSSSIKWRSGVALFTAFILFGVMLWPFGEQSALDRIRTKIYPAIVANWSRNDTGSNLYRVYNIGTWLKQHTSPDSLIISDNTFLRYWAMRPMIIGVSDYQFITDDFEERRHLLEASERLHVASLNGDMLLSFSQEYGADYIVVTSELEVSLGIQLVFEDENYRVYQIISNSYFEE